MVKDGPELIRLRVSKAAFEKVVLLWDHDGSGHEGELPEQVCVSMQTRLDQVTWRSRSVAVAVTPEIEEWLWHSPSSIASHLKTGLPSLLDWVSEFADKRNETPAACQSKYPKELFQEVLYRCARRRPLPRDFEQIAARASMPDWLGSQTFGRFVTTLPHWFPLSPE